MSFHHKHKSLALSLYPLYLSRLLPLLPSLEITILSFTVSGLLPARLGWAVTYGGRVIGWLAGGGTLRVGILV